MPVSVSSYNKKDSADAPPDPSTPPIAEIDPLLYRFSGIAPIRDLDDNIIGTVYGDSHTMKARRFDVNRISLNLR